MKENGRINSLNALILLLVEIIEYNLHVMKCYGIIIILLFTADITVAQVLKETDLFSGLQITVNYSSGLSKFKFNPNTQLPVNSPLLIQQSGSLELQYYIQNGWFVSASAGILITSHKNDRRLSGEEWRRYIDGLTWRGYRKFDIGIGKSKIFNSNRIIRQHFNRGGVWRRFSNRLRTPDKIHYTNSNFSPYGLYKASIGGVRNNKNLWEIGLYYRHSFANIYNGKFGNILEESEYSGTGTEIGLSLIYTFTRCDQRLARSESLKNLEEYRQKRRTLENGTRLLEVKLGFYSPLNIIRDPEQILLSTSEITIGGKIGLQVLIDQVQFWEYGLSFNEYWSGYTIVDNLLGIGSSSLTNDFYSLAFNIGRGMRVNTNKGLNLFALSSGITINGNLTSGGSFGSDILSELGGKNIYELIFETEVRSIIFASLYANINKGIQISKRMYISANFKYNLGLNATQMRRYRLSTMGSDFREIDGVINGTGYSVEIGMKYNLGKEEL